MRTPDTLATLGEAMVLGANADQAEALALSRGITAVRDSAADEIISGQLDDERGSAWSSTDELEEALLGQTLEHLEQRRKRLGKAYPFEIDAGKLRYSPSRTGVYEFCLNASLADHGNGQGTQWQIAFERLCALLVAEFLGGGESYRIGAPTYDLRLQPRRLKAASARLSEQCGEWRWNPPHPNPLDPDPSETQDEGIDFVAWKRFDDRPGSLFIAGQCACGQDWRGKVRDLDERRIKRWWPEATLVPFVRALAIPRAIPGFYVIGENSRDAGLMLDRLRLTAIAERTLVDHPIRHGWLAETFRASTPASSSRATKPSARPAPQLRKGVVARRSR